MEGGRFTFASVIWVMSYEPFETCAATRAGIPPTYRMENESPELFVKLDMSTNPHSLLGRACVLSTDWIFDLRWIFVRIPLASWSCPNSRARTWAGLFKVPHESFFGAGTESDPPSF